MATFEPVLTKGFGTLDLTDLTVYRKTGGFDAMAKAMRDMTPEAIVNEISASNLRGRGGAGFPTGKKWSFLPKDGRPRYLVCNSDEAEPGTFKDRMLLENSPFNLIEGLIISAYAINASRSSSTSAANSCRAIERSARPSHKRMMPDSSVKTSW